MPPTETTTRDSAALSMDGSVALISGAARGQGEAMARLLVERGASVVIGDVLDADGMAVAKSLGAAAIFVHLDVTNKASWASAAAAAEDQFGSLDVLINNAGIVRAAPIESMTEEDYVDVFKVNQLGCFLGMQAVVPYFRKVERSSIVNISSIAGMQGQVGVVSYVSTKWAIRGMSRSAALELGKYGTRINTVLPGTIDTPMIKSSDFEHVDTAAMFGTLPIPRVGQAAEVAQVVAFLVCQAASYITGAEFVVDGGVLAGDTLMAK